MDTVKVRMQVSTSGMLAVIKNTFREEGALAFYKGMEFPLIAVPLINACVFTTYEFCRRNLQKDDNLPMDYWKVFNIVIFLGVCVVCLQDR